MQKNNSSIKEGGAGMLQGPNSEYNQIKEYEHHFNNLETEIRKFASAWLLASLGAIAFLVRGNITGSLLPSKVLISIICLMGVIGLMVLWILDQLVYHRLLNAVFLLGLRMEYLYNNIPPIRTLMVLYSRKRGMARYLRLYYLIPMTALFFISLSATAWYVSDLQKSSSSGALSVTISFLPATIAAFIVIWVWCKSRRMESYDEIAERFDDEEFTHYLRDKKYEATLHRGKGQNP